MSRKRKPSRSRPVDAAFIGWLLLALALNSHEHHDPVVFWGLIASAVPWFLLAVLSWRDDRAEKRRARQVITIELDANGVWDEWSLAHVLSTELRQHRERTKVQQ